MNLDREEKEILNDYLEGKLERKVLSRRELDKYRRAAKATFAKDRRVNIRISSVDLQALQLHAIEEGIPYQTLMASVLHKFVAGKLREKGDNKRGERMLGRNAPSHRSR